MRTPDASKLRILTVETDHDTGLRVYRYQLSDVAVVHADAGPGLSAVGVRQLGGWAVSIPDIRCGGWKSGAPNASERAARRAI